MLIRQPLMRAAPWALWGALIAATPVTADPFRSPPGARAQAMAGAASALQDSASVWHNPAGVAFGDGGLRAQWYQTPHLDEETDELTSNATIFAGIQDTFGVWTTGFFYYTPYSQDYRVLSVRDDESASDGRVEGRVSASYRTLSAPIAISVGDGLLRLGLAVEWNHLSFSGSRLSASLDPANPRDPGTSLVIEPKTSGGASLSAGVLVRALDHQPANTRVNLGLVYRSGATDNARNAPGNVANADDPEAQARLNRQANRVLFGRPASTVLAASVLYEPSPERALILALQAERTRWSGRLAYQRFSIGSEYQFPLGGRYDIDMAFRGGLYQSRARESGDGLDWPDSQGVTAGVGVSSRDDYQLDLSLEHQSISHNRRNDNSTLLLGLQLSRFF